MSKKGGRRGGRRGQGNRRGGFGRANRSRSKPSSRSKSRTRSGGPRGQGNRRGGFGRAKGSVTRKSVRRGIRSVKKAASRVGKGIGRSLRGAAANAASFAANHPSLSSYNRRTRDMSQLTPQSRRRYQRLSEKTGRDYSQRIPSMSINLSADRLAQLGGFADSRVYKGLTKAIPGIKSLQINKQLYSNPMKKGWHSSQRTGRGQGLTPEAATRQQLSSFRDDPYEADKEWYDKYNPQGITVSQAKKMYANQLKEGATLEQAMRSNKAETTFFDALIPDREEPKSLAEQISRSSHPEFIHSRRDAAGLPSLRLPKPVRGVPGGRTPNMGPEPDWLGDLYSSHNISGGKLDQGARDYWTNEAKTKGRDAVMKSIIGTAKSQGTYGGRKKPQRINTGSRPTRTWRGRPIGPWLSGHGHTRDGRTVSNKRRGGGGPIGAAAAILAGKGLIGGRKSAKSARRKANLQNEGVKRRMAKSLAAHIAATRGM
tara:strand:- start:1227 stop:2678 length:1452 start_codon:yes stop_codon:yes gene_type:complete